MNEINFDPIYEAGTIDDNITCLNSIILKLFDEYVPIRHFEKSNLQNDWYTPVCAQAYQLMNLSQKSYLDDRTTANNSILYT